ncbi:MAG: hypothetical protein M5U34_01930 [Chloroflexi bacterium]|nr:hypothetical protein [Chloroflexota bacterium]
MTRCCPFLIWMNWRALLPQVEVHRLPECGHIVMLEKFSEFIEIAQAFWGKDLA